MPNQASKTTNILYPQAKHLKLKQKPAVPSVKTRKLVGSGIKIEKLAGTGVKT